jgi:hypothetical protein
MVIEPGGNSVPVLMIPNDPSTDSTLWENGVGNWNGWAQRGCSWPLNVMPMHFRLRAKIDPDNDATQHVATLYWYVQDFWTGRSKWRRFPGITVNKSDFNPNPDYPYFSVIDKVIVPDNRLFRQITDTLRFTDTLYTACGDDFQPIDGWFQDDTMGCCNNPIYFAFGGNPSWGGSNNVRLKIESSGHHALYVYDVEVWDEGFHRLFRAPTDTIAHYDSLIARAFSDERIQSNGKLAAWYYDEFTWDAIPAWSKTNQILQHAGLPTFILNDHWFDKYGGGFRHKLYYTLDTLGVHIPVMMYEFYPYGGDSTCWPSSQFGIMPESMWTTSNSDVPYSDTEVCTACPQPEQENQHFTRYNGKISLQAGLDVGLWGSEPFLWTAGFQRPLPPRDSTDLALIPGIVAQTQRVHEHGDKFWALIQGGAQEAINYDINDVMNGRAVSRFPTPNEVILNAWLSLSSGVDGIMWYWGMQGPRGYVDASHYQQQGGLIDWGTDSSHIDTSHNFTVPKHAYRTQRYFAAQKVDHEILRIAPLLESLDFIKTYASRVFQVNYGQHSDTLDNLGISSHHEDLLQQYPNEPGHPESYVEYIQTEKPGMPMAWNWEAPNERYVQVTRFKTPGESGEDYWFLIVNRRALVNETRRISLGISNVYNQNAQYAVQQILANTTTIAANDASIDGKVITVTLQPGEAELVHFSLADTATWHINSAQTLHAPAFLMKNIVIHSGGSLTILPDTSALRRTIRVANHDSTVYDSVATVTFWKGKGIRLEDHLQGAELHVMGSPTTQLRFQPANADSGWDGIVVSENTQDQVEFHYATIQGAPIGLTLNAGIDNWGYWGRTPWVKIDHCTFRGCATGLSMFAFALDSISHSQFTDNDCGIRCDAQSMLQLVKSTVSNNRVAGVQMNGGWGTFIQDTLIRNGGTMRDWEWISFLTGAVSGTDADIEFRCCVLSNNRLGAINVYNSTVRLADPGNPTPHWGRNIISDDGTAEAPLIQADHSTLIVRNGRNTINSASSDSKWIIAPRTDILTVMRDWRNNYWGRTDTATILTFLPGDVTITPFLNDTSGCDFTFPNDTGSTTPWEQDYDAGATELSDGSFDEARVSFREAVGSGSRTRYGVSGLQRILCTDLLAGDPDKSTKYFKDIADSAFYGELKTEAKFAQAWSLAHSADLDSAQSILQGMVNSGQTDTAKVEAKIAMLNLDLYRQIVDTTDCVTTAERLAVQDSINSLIASLTKWKRYDITDSVVMYAPCTVDSSITVEPGAVLVIKPYPGINNPVVNFTSGAGILVQGWSSYSPGPPAAKLYVLGDPDNRVILNWDTANTWTNIESRCGYMELKHAELRGAGWAVFDNNPTGQGDWPHVPVFKADSCVFRSFGDGITCDVTDSSSYIRNCLFTDLGGGVAQWNSYTAALTVMEYGQLTVENCHIEHGGEVGVAVCYGSGISMRNTTVNGSKSYGMVVSDGSDASLECCELSCNGDTLAEAWVDASTLNLVGAHSQFSDSSGALLYTADPSFVDLGDGENNFNLLTGSGHYLKSGDTTDTWDIGLNTWAPYTPTDTAFYSHLWPRNSARWLVDTSLATFVGCDQGGTMSFGGGSNFIIPGNEDHAGTDSYHPKNDGAETATSLSTVQPPTASKFSQAVTKAPSAVGPVAKAISPLAEKTVNRAEMLRLHHQELAQWREAKALCKSGDKQAATQSAMTFLRDHPGSKLAPAAMVDLSRLARKGDADQSVSKFLSVQAGSLVDPEQRKLAQRLSLVAKAREGKPVEALAGLEEIMETASTPRDSIRALMDAMGVYFFNQHDHSVQPRNNQVKTASHRELVHRVIQLTRMLDNPALAVKGKGVAIPTKYALYQNYPNPFNPNTEIRFDLPDAVRVELKIFNILGQEVAKLIDEVRPAGAYRFMWDSKTTSGNSVASGVYIYQLKAGKFVDSKKMMLIR